MAGVFIVLTVGAGIAFIILFLENKASSWLRGRCFGCFAKEEVFQKVSVVYGKPLIVCMLNDVLTWVVFLSINRDVAHCEAIPVYCRSLYSVTFPYLTKIRHAGPKYSSINAIALNFILH